MASMPRHFQLVASALLEGRLVPFLGAGANLCGRPVDETWRPGLWMPNAHELATALAGRFGVEPGPLIDVADEVSVRFGELPLARELRHVFEYDYAPTAVHRALAASCGLIRERGVSRNWPLFVTTNYDDLLERAFAEAGEPYDLVSYQRDAPFVHLSPAGERSVLRRHDGLDLLDQQAVIFKIHGSIDPLEPRLDTYVISEADYIVLLSDDTLEEVPVRIGAQLARGRLLFLGYAMRDWDVMVALRRMQRSAAAAGGGFAVELPLGRERERLIEARWRRVGNFDVIFSDLADYAVGLEAALDSAGT